MTFDTRKEITKLLTAAGESLRDERGIIGDYRIIQGHDTHAYYDLITGNRTLHVQGYPGMSNEREFMLNARVMDAAQIGLARERGASIGNEHSAVTHSFRYMMPSGLCIPYSNTAVQGVLSSCIHEANVIFFIDAIRDIEIPLKELKRIWGKSK